MASPEHFSSPPPRENGFTGSSALRSLRPLPVKIPELPRPLSPETTNRTADDGDYEQLTDMQRVIF